MANEVLGNIKIIRSIFEEFKKRFSTFPDIDKSLKDSEIFLNIQINDLTEDFQRSKLLHTSIIANGVETDDNFATYKKEKVYQAIQNIYFKHITNLHEMLKLVTHSERHDVTFTDVSSETFKKMSSNTNPSNSFYPYDVNYSYVEGSVPTFHGKYDKWPQFRDDYVSEVHDNPCLTDSSKLRILRSLLKDDAKSVVRREFGNLKSTDYEKIWKRLCDRYNHKRTIVYTFFGALLFQPQLEKESSSGLKSLYDVTYDSISSLKSLGLNCDDWDDLLLFIVYSKLPTKTKEVWNERQSSDKLPNFKDFLEFLEKKFRTLESLESTRNESTNSVTYKKQHNSKRVSTLQTSNNTLSKQSQSEIHSSQKHICKCCSKGSHAIRKCFKFQKMHVQERLKLIRSIGYCSNCLSFSHTVNDCSSNRRCSVCSEKHNTFLCSNSSSTSVTQENVLQVPMPVSGINESQSTNLVGIPSTCDGRFNRGLPSTYTTLVTESENDQYVVFPTALVKVIDLDGREYHLRAMVDACSDASYITYSAARLLKLQVNRTVVQISGLGDKITSESKGVTSFKIHSLFNEYFSKNVNAYVLNVISNNRPARSFKKNTILPRNIQLADPYFNKNSKIDILLGGDIDSAIHKDGSFKLENIVFRDTELGWIASGAISRMNCFASAVRSENLEIVLKSLDDTLKAFWEVKELSNCLSLSEEERLCEQIYNSTTVRRESGKYCVSLPFKCKVDGFSGMRRIALSRFFLLEIQTNHMTEVDPSQFPSGYYIPHHCVMKASSSTTKLRVVFDASARDSEGQSLNENLMNGPRIQSELLDHLLRFRFFKIAFTSDVAKMYRQILINPNDRKFQLILWRPDSNEEIRTYCLNTVTFGTTSAPYLAVKTLFRLAEDEQNRFPKGSFCLKNGFYVDDCIFGADNIDEALDIQNQTIQILSSAGLNLRKWSSNVKEILEAVPESDRETKNLLDFTSNSSVKTLGVQWCPSNDYFLYKIDISNNSKLTKRSILSEIAKIFDPLGWISPCVIRAKLLIQSLWSARVDWDQDLSEEFVTEWDDLKDGLSYISKNLRVPRWLQTLSSNLIEIHGFSDASMKAYAGAVYVKSGEHVNLLFAKTKVAPLKIISLPRLELMGALLLAKMMNHIKSVCTMMSVKLFYWSDSKITLAWLKDEPQKRTVFVAHRISEVQSLTDKHQWRYVESKSNPADLGTRGISALDLQNLNLWWHGPEFLKTFDVSSYNSSDLPFENILPIEENVRRKQVKCESVIQTFLTRRRYSVREISSNIVKFSDESLNKFSTLNKLVRVIAYCLRFFKDSKPVHQHISPDEYENALLVVLKMVQEEVYSVDIQEIQSDGLSPKSNIYSLNPFIDTEKGLLRVSGRLDKADHMNFDQKHPIMLPYSVLLSELIVRHAHLSTLHGTDQQTFMLVSQRYHIIRCKSLINCVSKRCVKCFRQRCVTQQQLMGQLPKYRITPNRPFLNSGVDFAGPFDIKRFKGRCQSHYKSYFAIFVCFSTKAVHLEVVIDLSSQAFIAAYRRFISRRGLVKNLYSDCGSNFKGAQGAVTRSMSEVDNEWNQSMQKELAEFQTTWHFNPPASPNFGGLWEAGVKSVKRHLKRIVGTTRLTYDEFETVLLQVEACLNSRPLCAIKNSAEVIVITPAHFLIQDNLLTMPEDNLHTKNITHLSRWSMLQKIVQDFWKIRNHEYLNTLRQRSKARQKFPNIRVDDVVVLKEDNMPPNSWLLGKVVEVFPGSDGLVRVVNLKTKKSILKRPIVKICPLPIQCN